jgi:hypothetical protein
MVVGDPAARPSRGPLSRVAAASNAYQVTLRHESDLRDERNRAMVRAIRAGARLDEVAEAAAISRAAVSKAARRTLPSRTGRGGRYSRRRGSSAALGDVAAAAENLAVARQQVHEARRKRDRSIAAAVASGLGVTETAGAVGMTPASVSVIARSEGQGEAMNGRGGAVASSMK